MHDTKGEEGLVGDTITLLGHQLSTTAMSTLQLEISSKASKIYDLQILVKSAADELEQVLNVSMIK